MASQLYSLLFAGFLCFAAVSAHLDVLETTAEDGTVWVGPIRKCIVGSTDEELDNCVEKIRKDLTPKLRAGISEIGAVPLEPYVLDKFSYEFKAGPLVINVAAKNIQLAGFTNYNKLKFRTETQETQTLMHFDLEVPNLDIDTVYKAGGNAVVFPITGAGPANIQVAKLRVKGHLVGKKAIRDDGTPIVQVEKTVFTDMDIESYRFRASGLFNGNTLLSTAVHYIANQYNKQIFELLKPEIMRQANDVLLTKVLNPVLANLPYVHDYMQ